MLKAIETEYNGYRFRSRLEARWAVFFDALRITYEYEPEGFEFSDGERYLPDFYLPDYGVYVEIKPMDKNVVKHVGDGNEWERKCSKFRDETGHAILLCYGDPAASLFKMLYAFDKNDSNGGSVDVEAMFEYLNQNVYIIAASGGRSDHVLYVKEWERNRNTNYASVIASQNIEYYGNQLFYDSMKIIEDIPEYEKELPIQKAMLKARQARFEYGETPKTYKREDGMRHIGGLMLEGMRDLKLRAGI